MSWPARIPNRSRAVGPECRIGSTDLILEGRARDLSVFKNGIASMVGNGTTFLPADFDTTFVNGLTGGLAGTPGILERNLDSTFLLSQTSEVVAQDLAVWDLILDPGHKISLQRPRSQITSKELKPYTPYRMQLICKLKKPSSLGWNQYTINQFLGTLFAISQQSGTGDYVFSAGQLGTSSSPLYLNMTGSLLEPQIRVPCVDLALTPGDPGAVATYKKWGIGDEVYTALKIGDPVGLTGEGYHVITCFFYLDEKRPGKDGGKGYFRLYIDGEPWIMHDDITMLPRNEGGFHMPVYAKLGLYETSGNANADVNALVSTVSSCTVQRALRIRHYSIVEIR